MTSNEFHCDFCFLTHKFLHDSSELCTEDVRIQWFLHLQDA